MNRTALITGASSGIGLELAKLFARDGYNLILTARRTELLDRLCTLLKEEYKIEATVLSKDLTAPNAASEIFAELKKQNISIDVLVNNAGFGAHGKFAELDTKVQMDEIQVNVVALTELTRLFVPELIAKGSGGIINIASIAAFQPGPLMSVYYATKAYVVSFSEALANELAGSGVAITCVCPGVTQTEFDKIAGVDTKPLFRMLPMMSAAQVAKIGYAAFKANRALVITGLHNRLFALCGKLAPSGMSATVARALHE